MQEVQSSSPPLESIDKKNSRLAKAWFLLAVVACVLVGSALRLHRLNWDSGLGFHPDEVNIALAVARMHFPDRMEPHFYAYNGFPLAMCRLATDLDWAIHGRPVSPAAETASILRAGRKISAGASILSILAAAGLGCLMGSRRQGAILAALTALNAGLLQASHFATVESLLCLELLLAAVVAAQMVVRPEKFVPLSAAMGVVLGFSLGTKTSGALFFVMPLAAAVFCAPRAGTKRILAGTAILLVVSAAVFFAVSPYTFLRWDEFLKSMRYEHAVAVGGREVFYTLSFIGSRPYEGAFWNLLWLCTPAATAIGIFGATAMLAVSAVRRKPAPALPLVAFGACYFAYVGSWRAGFVRYMVPVIPVLLACTAWLVWEMTRQRRWRITGIIAAVVAMGSAAAWSAAFMNVYTRPSTRAAASIWMAENASATAAVVVEDRDYALPLPVVGKAPPKFRPQVLNIYADETSEKRAGMAATLSEGDFLILASRRGRSVVAASPDRFSILRRYYEALDDGRLGYVECVRFTRYPRLFGWEINDDAAEGTFQVFDHPQVNIYRNVKKLPAAAMNRILAGD
jgi:hypothetical protein